MNTALGLSFTGTEVALTTYFDFLIPVTQNRPPLVAEAIKQEPSAARANRQNFVVGGNWILDTTGSVNSTIFLFSDVTAVSFALLGRVTTDMKESEGLRLWRLVPNRSISVTRSEWMLANWCTNENVTSFFTFNTDTTCSVPTNKYSILFGSEIALSAPIFLNSGRLSKA